MNWLLLVESFGFAVCGFMAAILALAGIVAVVMFASRRVLVAVSCALIVILTTCILYGVNS